MGDALITLFVEGDPQDCLFVVAGVFFETAFDLILEAAVIGFVFGVEAVGVENVVPKEMFVGDMLVEFFIVFLKLH